MATLVAIGYSDQTTAEEARQTVQSLEAELIIQADQVAAISRDLDGKYHVTTTHGGASAGGGAAWGGFWGLLFGLLFFVPFAGLALGAGMGALFGHLGEKGIDKQFQAQVRDHLAQRTTADWMGVLEPAGIWAAPVLDWPALMAEPAFAALEATQQVRAPDGAALTLTRCPIRVDGAVLTSPRAAPRLGGDRASIDRELGQ